MSFRFSQRRFAAAAASGAMFETLESRQLMADVTGLVLYNADNGQPIRALQNNATIDYAALPTRNLSVRANVAGAAGSVRFALDGDADFRTENHAPYSINGDHDATGRPNPWTPARGTHALAVRAFSGPDASGTASAPLSVTFNVTDSGGGGGTGTGGGTTSDTPVVHFSDAEADAKEAGLDRATWVVSRSGSTAASLTVKYTVGGTATNGVDYQTLSGSITIPAGSSSVNLVVVPKDDATAEATETVTVTLAADGAYVLGSPANASAPIYDNDGGSTGGDPGTTPPPPAPSDSIGDITWSRNAPRSPLPRTEAGIVQIGSKVYVIGGFTAQGGTGDFFPLTRRVHRYDMATRTWKELASLPAAAAANHSGVATDGTYIYVVAGQIKPTYGAGTNTTWRYHIANNTWQQFKSLPEIRFGGAAFVDGGKLHFVGGTKADRETPASDHWAIDLSNPSAGWVRKAAMPVAQDHISHAKVNGKVYIIGGEHGHHGLDADDHASYIQHKNTFEYDPAADTWRRRADLPVGLSHVEGSTLVINDKIVVIGGLLDGGSPNQTSAVRVYDPAANTWKTLATRYPKRIIGASAGYWNGKIYMTDGYSPDSTDRSAGYEGIVRFT